MQGVSVYFLSITMHNVSERTSSNGQMSDSGHSTKLTMP